MLRTDINRTFDEVERIVIAARQLLANGELQNCANKMLDLYMWWGRTIDALKKQAKEEQESLITSRE